ncbi:MAG: DUF3857 domain-containing protein [Bacillota bacterium]
MYKKNSFIITVTLMLVLLFTGISVMAVDEATVEEIMSNAPSQEDYPDAGGIIIQSEVISDFTAVPYKTRVNKIYKVFNKRGIERFGEASIRFDKGREKIELVEAYTITPDGDVVEVDENAVHEITPSELSEANIYSNIKDKVINLPALESGAIIVYSYIRTEEDPLIDGHFWNSKQFGYREPIQETSLSVKVPSDKKIFSKTIRDDLEPEIVEGDGYKQYTWEKKDLDAIIPEVAMPPLADIVPVVRVSTFETWQEFSDWYSGLIKDQYKLNDAIKEKIAELTSDIDSREDKIQALYNYVATNIRYVGLEFGIDGYKPHTAINIFENKYGDCKDKATLLIAMLSEIGVKGEPVLISTADHSNLEIVSPGHFNHMIVYLPEQDLYVDPTSDVTKFGNLPAADQGKKIIMPAINKIVETPVAPAEENREHFRQEVKLSEDGSAVINITWSDRGVYDSIYRNLFKQYNDHQRGLVLKQIINSYFPNAAIEDYTISGVDSLENDFQIDLVLSTKDYSQNMGNLIGVQPFRIALNVGQIVGLEERTYPLYMGYNFNASREILIELPAGYDVNFIPEDVNIESEIGSLAVNFAEEGQMIKANLDLKITEPLIELEKYQQVRNLLNTAGELTQKQILIKPNNE